MKIAREGYPFAIAGIVLAAACWAGVRMDIGPTEGFGLLTLRITASVLSLLAVFVLWFFRDPEPDIPAGPDLVVSPGQGKVILIEEVDETSFMDGPARKISIFVLLEEETRYLGPRQVKVLPKGQQITLRCRRQIRVRGRVLRQDGSVAPRARLELRIDGDEWAWNCDGAGRFDFPAPASAKRIDFKVTWETPDGTRRLGVRDGYRPTEGELEITLDRDDE